MHKALFWRVANKPINRTLARATNAGYAKRYVLNSLGLLVLA